MEDSPLIQQSQNQFIKYAEYAAFLFAGLGILLIIAAIAIFTWKQKFETNLQIDTSLMGDFGSLLSGTVGVCWSLASVLLFYLALREQRRDIEINHASLKAQIEEIKGTREVYQGQSDTLKTQTFENTFFQLLQLHLTTANGLEHNGKKGKEVFTVLKDELYYITCKQGPGGAPGETMLVPITTIEEVKEYLTTNRYNNVYRNYENLLDHYFRQLYHIYKYIHISPLIPDVKRAFYASLIRAQLSQNELFAIVYNSLMEGYGYPKFLFLVKEYDVIKNFKHDQIMIAVWDYFNDLKEKVRSPF